MFFVFFIICVQINPLILLFSAKLFNLFVPLKQARHMKGSNFLNFVLTYTFYQSQYNKKFHKSESVNSFQFYKVRFIHIQCRFYEASTFLKSARLGRSSLKSFIFLSTKELLLLLGKIWMNTTCICSCSRKHQWCSIRYIKFFHFNHLAGVTFG